MRTCIKKTVPGCLGASIAVTAVEFFRNQEMWTISNLVVNFVCMFIVTTVIVTVLAFVWKYVVENKRKRDR